MSDLDFHFVNREEDDFIPYEPHLKDLVKHPRDICVICLRLLFYRFAFAYHYKFGFGHKTMCASCCEIQFDFEFHQNNPDKVFYVCDQCQQIDPPLYTVRSCRCCNQESRTCSQCDTQFCKAGILLCNGSTAQWAHIIYPLLSWLVSPEGRENDIQYQMAIARPYDWVFRDRRFRRACDSTVYEPFDISQYILGYCFANHEKNVHKPGDDCYQILWDYMYRRLCDVLGVASGREGRGNWPPEIPYDWKLSSFREGDNTGEFSCKMWYMRKHGMKTNYQLPGSQPHSGAFNTVYFKTLPIRNERERIDAIPHSPYAEIPLPRMPKDNYKLYEQRLKDAENELVSPVQSVSREVIVVPDPDLDPSDGESTIIDVVDSIPTDNDNMKDQLSDYLSDYHPSVEFPVPIDLPIRPSTPALTLASDKILQVQLPIEKKKRGRPRKHPLPSSPLAQNVISPQPLSSQTKLNKSV